MLNKQNSPVLDLIRCPDKVTQFINNGHAACYIPAIQVSPDSSTGSCSLQQIVCTTMPCEAQHSLTAEGDSRRRMVMMHPSACCVHVCVCACVRMCLTLCGQRTPEQDKKHPSRQRTLCRHSHRSAPPPAPSSCTPPLISSSSSGIPRRCRVCCPGCPQRTLPQTGSHIRWMSC